MYPTQILQILPRLPPAICGVGDHATGVGMELSRSHRCDVDYLGVNPADLSKPLNRHELPQRSAAAMLNALKSFQLADNAVVVLHFSGYSYGKRGLCSWLTTSLSRYREERPDIKLITMFHELWSPAPLFSKSGWVVPLQQHVIRRLVKLSDVVRTNREEYRDQIEKLCPQFRGRVRVKNICSNFGEPEAVRPFDERKRQILIFQPPSLATVGGNFFWDQWHEIQMQLGGVPTIIAGRAKEIPVDPLIQQIGFVSTEDGARLIDESQFAFFEYFQGYIGKSSLFGSLAAYGIVPIMPRLNASNDEGLLHGTHYLIPGDATLGDRIELELVSRRLCEWYAGHSISATATDYMQSVFQCVRKSA
jgi:hypothetical protein